MLQKQPSLVAIPADSVTACCSAIPTSKARSGKASIMNFKELPEGMAGVIPLFFVFGLNLISLNQNVLVFRRFSSSFLWISPLASNFPGAWYFTWSSSACFNPLPVVIICRNLGPFIFVNVSIL
jgi:hypothetical protein